jgi:Fic family protein
VQLNRFENSPIGKLIPISGTDGRLGRAYDHFAFVPDPLPNEVDLRQRTYKLLSEADRAVGGLNAKAQLLPNASLLVRPALTKEAVATSALEGTFAPLSDVLEAEYVSERKRSAEVLEIQNYVRAAAKGIELTQTLPICLKLVARLQKILVRRTRGDSNDAGRLRERQVCIGDEGAGIEESRYVPPPPGAVLSAGIDEWEKWVNAEDDLPLLVKAALAHYQFEALHPFSDGNGRLGRLIVTLQLMEAGVLDYPILNLSPWLEPRRSTYIDQLLEVSATGNFDPWVSFFAQAVKARALAATAAIQDLLEVRDEFQSAVRNDGAKGRVIDLAGDLIGFPVLDVGDAAKLLDVTYPAANSAVHRLVRLGILREVTGGTYGRIFRCERVYQILAEA